MPLAASAAREGRETARTPFLTSASRETCQREDFDRTGCSGVGQAGRAPRRRRAPFTGWQGNDVTQCAQIELLVCTSCRRGRPTTEAERPGALLCRRLAAFALAGVRVTGVECLSNCNQGCTIALRGPGRWTYVYGNLDAGDDLGAIAQGIARYRATPDGLVPWRERPEHFRKNCIARIPPLETV